MIRDLTRGGNSTLTMSRSASTNAVQLWRIVYTASILDIHLSTISQMSKPSEPTPLYLNIPFGHMLRKKAFGQVYIYVSQSGTVTPTPGCFEKGDKSLLFTRHIHTIHIIHIHTSQRDEYWDEAGEGWREPLQTQNNSKRDATEGNPPSPQKG